VNKAKKFNEIDGPAKVALLAGWLDEKQAGDIMAIDVSEVCPITEHVMVATARGARHAQALADAMLAFSGDEGLEYLGMEGYQSADWVLMDFNDVILHIFQPEVRSLYNIEGLWSEGSRMPLDMVIESGA
jgi:ribosome-associated protein